MESYGFLSILPPILAIFLAIITRQVYISLLLGIWLGWLILSDFNFIEGSLATVEGLVSVFADPGNTRTILFCALVGALIVLMQKSGGVLGFIQRVTLFLARIETKNQWSQRKLVQLLAWFTGVIIFVESSISVLTVGTLYRPLFDQLKIPREKLAYIADSSSAPSSILIPFNGWGAFIMSLLLAQGFQDPFATMVKAISLNFYPMLALCLVLIIIISNKDFGPMAKAENRTKATGALMNPDSKPMVSDELTSITPVANIDYKPINMIFPIVVMVGMMPVMLAYTGWESAISNLPNGTRFQQFVFALGQGSGSTSVLIAVITSIITTVLFYRIQKIMRFKEMIQLILKGTSEMVPLAMLMLFAFAIGNVCKAMETGQYVASITQEWLSPGLVPFLIFLVTCFIAFSTGTSWGTFAIMMAIAIPMAESMQADPYMTIAAVLGGGVFGDHCSPISDTTILSSMASASDHIDHVKTQLPYASIAGVITAAIYFFAGII
ncbi:MAG: Na+/H+ antiporter NhaC family protein [Saprospiraceae bacterium]